MPLIYFHLVDKQHTRSQRMTETTIITTQIRTESEDFDIRREFCGFQDKRLNALREFTSCIIDLQTHGSKDPFEKVTWVISHFDEAVRAFVVKRIQTWGQSTQIAAQIHSEDLAFQQQTLSDSSSSSYDAKVQRFENSTKSSPSPPRNSVPNMFKKTSKTPLHDHHSGSVANAALVPQTEIQSRYQERRRRNSSSSSSGIRRPALFGKPSDYFFSRANDHPRSRYSPLSTPVTKNQSNDKGFSLIKPTRLQMEKDYSFDAQENSNKENQSEKNVDQTDYEEEAKWENLLSDCSDFESNSHPLMGDIFLVSQLRDCLMNSDVSSNDEIDYIQSILTPSLSITMSEQVKRLNDKSLYFCRLTLNSKIILANGIHPSRPQAHKLAYKKLLELMTNPQGVELKLIANGRMKVVAKKSLPVKNLNETTIIDSTINITTESY